MEARHGRWWLGAGLALALGWGAYQPAHGQDRFEPPYRVVPDWPKVVSGKTFGAMAGVAVDSNGNVYGFERDTGQVHRFDQAGNFTGSLGGNLAGTPDSRLAVIGSTQSGVSQATGTHGISVDSEDYIWIADRDRHVVKRVSPDGTVVLTIGKEGVFGKTQDTFNGPTQVFELREGNMLVLDGYWNSRMVWFDKHGRYLREVGTYGRGPGEFGTL